MKRLPLLVISLVSIPAFAHVSLDAPRAEAGAAYQGVLRVGHGCDGAPTTSLEVRIPAGVSNARGIEKPGWTLTQGAQSIVWTAARDTVLDPKDKGEFGISLQAPAKAGPAWLKVLQRCQGTSLEWADVPAQGTSVAGMKTPAVLLDVLSREEAAALRRLPQVSGAWVRAAVPGQQATGAFMQITAKEPMDLVGASSPAAGTTEVHEMKMEGDVMRMRPAGKLALPAGRAVELRPGGYHLMLQELKQPLAAGTTVPLTLVLRDASGTERKLELQLPVLTQPPGGADASPAGHKH